MQVAFLEHLDAFDERRGYAARLPLALGVLHRVLHLAEAQRRRIGAMRALRRHPSLRAALLEGRLSLSTLRALEPVLTEENLAEQVERASFRGLREVEALVAAMRPEPAPSDGLRRASSDLTRSAPTLRATAKPLEREAARSAGHDDAPLFSCSPASSTARFGLSQEAPSPAPLSQEVASSPLATTPSTPPPGAPSSRPGAESLTPPSAEHAPRLSSPTSATPRGEEPRAQASGMRSDSPERATSAEVCWSLRVTLDAEARADLEALTALLSHRVPKGDLAAVLKVALRSAVTVERKRRRCELREEKVQAAKSRQSAARGSCRPGSQGHGERVAMAARRGDSAAPSPISWRRPGRGRPELRPHTLEALLEASSGEASAARPSLPPPTAGAADPRSIQSEGAAIDAKASPTAGWADAPAETTPAPARGRGRPNIPAAVRREVWKRDGGCCTHVAPDGTRCDSRWQLELDHLVPFALGGPNTVDNLAVRCRVHNQFRAEASFGRDHMARFRRWFGGSRDVER